MHLSKGSSRRAAADNGLESLVSPISATQTVPVGYVGPPSSELEAHGSVQEFDPDFPFEESAAPRVVISAKHADPDAGLGEIGQDSENLVVPTQYHRAVLEPEIEQIAVDQKVVGNVG
jgi:hypothetical protein